MPRNPRITEARDIWLWWFGFNTFFFPRVLVPCRNTTAAALARQRTSWKPRLLNRRPRSKPTSKVRNFFGTTTVHPSKAEMKSAFLRRAVYHDSRQKRPRASRGVKEKFCRRFSAVASLPPSVLLWGPALGEMAGTAGRVLLRT